LRHDVSKFSRSICVMLNVENVQSHFKLRHQVTSTSTSTSFLTPPPPPRGHPLPPSSALANAHMWANPGQACRPQQSHAPPHHHLQPTKKGKKHDDSDSDNDNGKEDDDDDDDEGNDDDDDDDEGKGEGEKVIDDGKGTKRAKRAAKAAKCVPATFFNIDSNVFSRRKALDRMREDALASAAPLPKKLPRYVPLPPFF